MTSRSAAPPRVRRGSMVYFLRTLAKRRAKSGEPARRGAGVVPVCDGDRHPPFFCVHAGQGEVDFLNHLRRQPMPRPIFGLRAQGLDDGKEPLRDVGAMADLYTEKIRETQPEGPYLIGGCCIGGLVACEMAVRLLAAGEEVGPLFLFDTLLPEVDVPPREEKLLRDRRADWRRALAAADGRFDVAEADDSWERVARDAHAAGMLPETIAGDELRRRERVWVAATIASLHYRLPRIPRRIVLYWASMSGIGLPEKWARLATAGFEATEVEASHFDIFRKPALALHLRQALLDPLP